MALITISAPARAEDRAVAGVTCGEMGNPGRYATFSRCFWIVSATPAECDHKAMEWSPRRARLKASAVPHEPLPTIAMRLMLPSSAERQNDVPCRAEGGEYFRGASR